MSTENQTTTSSNEREIPLSVLNELEKAGASKLFLDVIRTPVVDVESASRNYARQEILKYIDWAEDSNKEVTDYLNYGGGFFQSLFEGKPTSADSNNQRILEYVRKTNDGSTGVIAL